MITLEQFAINFPLGISIPTMLLDLLEYGNRDRNWYSGYFELTKNGRRAAVSWFNGDEVAANQFVLFGEGSDGDSYGFWIYDNHSIDTAPLIYLNGEGVKNKVLANNLRDFLALLAVGYDALGHWEGHEVVQTEYLTEFQHWLRDSYGIEAPSNPDKLIENAQKQHPSLDDYIWDWFQSHQKK